MADLYFPLPARHRDGFQVLGTHHGSGAIMTGDMTPVTNKGGKLHQVLAGGTDGENTRRRKGEPQFLLYPLFRFPGILAGQVAGIP